MTRRKWTKLRRQLPHLFAKLPAFEALTRTQVKSLRKVGKKEAIATQGFRLLAEMPPFHKPDLFESEDYVIVHGRIVSVGVAAL